MDDEYLDLVIQAKHWAQEVIDGSWASASALNQLLKYDERTPDSLFNETTSRPLIVAFLGGSGVGKSTLLNRLAGQQIALASAVRPTSREVTLFHHRSVKIAHLADFLPLEKIKIAQHSEENNKHIIWVDMPDFDSTEQSNQQLTLQCLAHIDVLIYVVSPERYRDSKAWQILISEGGRHAWVFVLNQADQGHAEQYQDFVKQLGKAGFDKPLVYQTSCVTPRVGAEQLDEFDALQLSLQHLATENTLQQLKLRNQQVRKTQLGTVLRSSLQLLGPINMSAELITFWHDQGLKLHRLLVVAMALPQQKIAAYYALHSRDLQHQQDTHLHQHLWDEWAQARFDDALDALILQADQLDMPVMPMKQQLLPIRASAKKIVEEKTLLSVRKALIKPGNALQRLMLKIARYAEIILPILAMVWVTYRVLIEFYSSGLAGVPHYVGIDFAINSMMLIVMPWFITYFIRKKLQPSIEKTALKGLNQGFITALQTLEIEVLHKIKESVQVRKTLGQQAEVIIQRCHKNSHKVIDIPENIALQRMLL